VTDAEIISRVLAGRTERFTELVDRYLPMVRGLCASRVYSPAAQEDLVQDVFVYAFEKLDQLRNHNRFGPWLARITRSKCADWLRRERRRQDVQERLAQQRADTNAGDARTALMHREMCEWVRNQIGHLPTKTREAMILRYVAGLSIADAARFLDVKQAAVKKRLEYGRRLIGEKLFAEFRERARDAQTPEEAEKMKKRVMEALPLGAVPWKAAMISGGTSAAGVPGRIVGALVAHKTLVTVGLAVAGIVCVLKAVDRIHPPPTGETQLAAATAQGREEVPGFQHRTVGEDASLKHAQPSEPKPVSGAKLTGDQEPLRDLSGVIRGRLIDTDGNPIGNMPVTLEQLQKVDNEVAVSPQRDRATQTVETNEEGFFEFTGLAFGVTEPGTPIVNDVPYSVYAKTSRALALKYVVLPEMSKEREIILNLRAAGSIAGRVVDERGAPVSGATIYPEAHEQEYSRWLYTPLCVETDNDGLFIFTHLWHGRWQFSVRAAGYAPLVTEFVPVGEKNAEFVLGQGGSVAGQIVEASTGSPVPGLGLYLLLPSGLLRDGFAQFTAKSDANGCYRIDAIPESSRPWTMALKRGAAWVFAGEAPRFMIEDGRETDLLVEVVRGGTVSGRVYDIDTGEGIANVAIEATLESGQGPSSVEARTDSSGHYRMEGLGEAVYLIECGQTQRYLPAGPHDMKGPRMLSSGVLLAFQPQADKRVASRFGEEIDGIDFPVTRGAVIRGCVLDMEGRPVANASIVAGHEGDRRWHGGPTGQDGTFEISGFASGPDFYVGAVRVEGIAPAAQGPFYLTDRGLQDIEFVLEPEGSISGIVVDPAGRPIVRARVIASPASEWQFGHPSTHTDIEGRFRICGLFADKYTLKVTPPGSPLLQRRPLAHVDVKRGQQVTGVVLVLDRAELAAVRGTVRIGGQPAVNQLVAIRPSGKPIYAALDTHTDERGAYILQGLAPGDYDVRVDATTRQNNIAVTRSISRQITVETGRTVQVDFEFAAGDAVIEGEVAVNGRPPRSAHISAWLVGISGETEWLHTSVRHDGSYRLEGLPASPLDIEVRAQPEEMSGELSRSLSLDLISGRILRQDFSFSGTAIIAYVSNIQPDQMTIYALLVGEVDLPAPFTTDFLHKYESRMVSLGPVASTGLFGISCVEPGTYTLVVVAGPQDALTESTEASGDVWVASTLVQVDDQPEVYVELELP